MEMPMDMQHQAMGYDRTATMFSPEGKLLQVEYAEKAVRLGSASIGMVCTDGVFIIADKRAEEKLLVKDSANKVVEIDSHIIASFAGILSDARILIERAQVLAQQHRVTYNSPIEPELVIKEIANMQQQFTQYGGARPFGVSMMIAGIHDKKGEVFVSDITGNYFSYYANVIGEDDEKIRNELREKYKQVFTMKQGVKLALEIFEKVQGSKFSIKKFELVYIDKESVKLKKLEGESIKEL
jgi:proteasome alpha subunit